MSGSGDEVLALCLFGWTLASFCALARPAAVFLTAAAPIASCFDDRGCGYCADGSARLWCRSRRAVGALSRATAG
jgi:hypothetical protein